MNHYDYIIAAYLITATILLTLFGVSIIRYRRFKKQLTRKDETKA